MKFTIAVVGDTRVSELFAAREKLFTLNVMLPTAAATTIVTYALFLVENVFLENLLFYCVCVCCSRAICLR